MFKESVSSITTQHHQLKKKKKSSEVWQQKAVKGPSKDYINATGIIQAKIKVFAEKKSFSLNNVF